MITSKVNDSYISIGDAYSGDKHIETIYDKDGNIVFSSSKAIKSPPPISFYQKFRYSNNLIETLTTTGYISATDAMYYAITSNIFSPEFSWAYENTSVVGFASTKICRLKTTKYIKKLYFRTGSVFIDDSDYGRKVRIFYPSGTLVDSITNISPNTILEFYIAIEFASNDPLYINKLPPEHMTDIFMDITPYDIETYPEDEYLHPNDDNFISLVLGENAKCDYEKAGVKIVDKPISNYRIYGNTVDGESVGDRTANLFANLWKKGYIRADNGREEQIDGFICSGFFPVEYGQTYSISRNINVGYDNIRGYRDDGSFIGAGTDICDVSNPFPSAATNIGAFTVTNENVAFIRFNDSANDLGMKYMIVEGTYTEQTMPDYEPYGYEVPVTINNVTTNFYLPEPLKMVGNDAEYVDFVEQKQYFADGTSVDVELPALPILSGTNTLSIGTEVQPSNVYLKGKIKEVSI